MALQIHYGLVCDEVRREDNGKLILIGVYGTNIQLSEATAHLALTCVLLATASEAREIDIEFEALFNGAKVSGGGGGITVSREGDSIIGLPPILFSNLTPGGNVEFRIKQDGSDWKTVRSIPVDGGTST